MNLVEGWQETQRRESVVTGMCLFLSPVPLMSMRVSEAHVLMFFVVVALR